MGARTVLCLRTWRRSLLGSEWPPRSDEVDHVALGQPLLERRRQEQILMRVRRTARFAGLHEQVLYFRMLKLFSDTISRTGP
jgi:hypothetical protein